MLNKKLSVFLLSFLVLPLLLLQPENTRHQDYGNNLKSFLKEKYFSLSGDNNIRGKIYTAFSGLKWKDPQPKMMLVLK